MIHCPGRITGNHPLGAWLNRLRDFVQASHLRAIVGGRIIGDQNGMSLILDGKAAGVPEIAVYRLDSVSDDYVTVHTYDVVSDTEGTDAIYVAKPLKLRTTLASEVKYGTTHTYTYSAGPDSNNKNRNDDWGTGDEDQLVTPPWSVDDQIIAIRCPTVILQSGGNDISLAMLSPWRQWAKIA